MKLTEEQVLKAIHDTRLHEFVPAVLSTTHKDGIDIDVPRSVLMDFVEKVREIQPADPYGEEWSRFNK